MKMEADSLKMKSAQTVTDAGGLTFGPAWLRQLSSGDTNKNALPPSPGLAFQLSKHRYSREEMLAIFETIEKSLAQKSPPNLAEEFEELYKRDLQRPVLLTPPSLEEQKFLSTCVNSQVVLNTYNKIQGQPGSTNSSNSSNSSSQRNGDGGSRDSRGGSNSIRGSRGGGRGGMGSERGRGRGGMRGGGRGGHESSFKTIDEEGNPNTNSGGRGGGRGGSASGSYRRAGWDEREGRDSNSSGLNGEKRYSKAMSEDNWRNRAAPAEESDSSSESKPTHSGEVGKNEQDGETNQTPSSNWRNSSEKTPSSQRDNWSTSKNSHQSSSYNERHNRDAYSKEKSSSRDQQPEWLDDDDEENTMTFDKSGNFVSVKELNKPARSKENSVEKQSDSNSRSQSRDTESNEPQISESETTTTTADNNKANDDIKTNENEEESSKSEDVDKVEQKEEEKSEPLTAEQEQQKLLDENLNQMSLSDFSNLTSAADLLLSKNSLPTNNPNPSFESLQAIHQQLQQQQLKLKNELLLAQLNTDPKRGPVAGDHQDADRWFYLDPQNQIQGSFSSEQMAGWFTAGYFNMSLMVKRGRDEKFAPLGVVSNNWGRIPFTSGPQPFSTSPQQQQQQSQPVQVQPQQQPQQQPSKEQIIQQMQLFQRFQQMQLMPQNINLLRNELTGNGNSMANLGGVLQQLQQLQIQQNAALAAANSIGPGTASQIIQDIRSQQEMIISQFAANNSNGNNNNLHQNLMKEQLERQSLPDLDPAILGAAPSKSQSVWNDLSSGSRQSPINHLNPTPPPNQHSISPINFFQQQLQSNSQHSSTNSLNQLGQFTNLDTNLLAQQIREFNSANNSSGNPGNNNMVNMMMNDSNIKDKIQKLFEQTKQDEEKRRKLMEEQMKAKREEDEKRRKLMEEQKSREQEQRRIQEEEQRVREEQRKEQQRKKLAEIIIMQEEEKKKADEMKKKREEENRLKAKEEKLKEKQRHEAKKLELAEAERRLQEENQERRRQELYAEQQRKQAEQERQRAKAQQDQLNNLQLPAHANWAKQNAQQQHQQQQAQLKSILEQQALESMQQRLLEQQKQAELNALQQDRQSSWSSLFRGNAPPPASTPSSKEAKEPTPVSLASIQAEQIKKEPVKAATTMSAKIQQANSQQPTTFKQTNSSKASSQQQSAWGSSQASPSASAWGTSNGGVSSSTSHTSSKQQQSSVSQSSNSTGHNNDTSSYSNSNSNSNSSTGFWTDINDKKSSKNAKQQQNKSQFPDLGNNHNNHADRNSSKTAKKMAALEESVQQIFLRNMTISDEFMKWCHEQLKDFHVELHIPTFVNFLREIESCNEIEEYVVNYLGDSQHAKDFAHQFYINRESQIKQQNNLTDEQVEESTYAKESQFSKKQKKRSKGQRVDHQLLGFTVQPDPNLKNRGDIDPL